MCIDIAQFTPGASFGGGVLIGLAAVALILLCGRIAGISGILGGVLAKSTPDKPWRVAFLIGMISAPLCYAVFAPLPVMTVATSWPGVIIAGLLVGIGTRVGSGCTSGHGVCGLSRLSLRSLVATMMFMATGFFAATLLGYGLWGG